MSDEKKVFRCDVTGKEVLAKSTPTGWKRFGDRLLCPEAVKQEYGVGCVSIPVRFYDDKERNASINSTINAGFGLSTALANWLITELYVRDTKRSPEMKKIPKGNNASLYQEAKERFPLDVMPSGLLACMEHRIRQKYSEFRYDVIWTGKKSLPSFRYPHPYPVREQDWSITVDEDGHLSVSVNIARERMTLELSRSHKYVRQRAGLMRIINGDGKFGQVVIVRKKDGEVRCQVSGYFPKKALSELQGEFHVRTDRDSLIVAVNMKDDKLWEFHGDQVRRWVQEHRRNLNRWSDDTKFEDRTRSRFQKRKHNRQTVESIRDAAVKKYRNRMDTLIDQLSIRIVNYAARRKFAKIVIDFSDAGYVDRFPWHELKVKVKQKADLRGIQVEDVAD